MTIAVACKLLYKTEKQEANREFYKQDMQGENILSVKF